MSDLKTKQIFSEPLQGSLETPSLTAQQQFNAQEKFVPMNMEEPAEEALEVELDTIIRPSKGRKWFAGGLFATFSGLVAWQAIDSMVQAIQHSDWLSLGWVGFISALATLGLGAIAKELWKLRRLRQHFSVQEQAQILMENDAVGQGQVFCEQIAKQGKVDKQGYQRWLSALNSSHSDAEILDLYDALVVGEQDKQASQIVTRYATEAAALVAISPLAIADMLLVAWRNFSMVDQLAKVYGVELGYWSRIKLFKAVLLNMALAGASELAVDASVDLFSMDLAGRLSARAGQGVGVGILTARLGIKAVGLLRPLPWHPDRQLKLSAVRKQVVSKVAALLAK
ncbi:TIGR01620 family protein [Vibrio cholerae]|uniref:YcjF family protein n=1 Tax=Vibrio cholerae TaxID=666 RepID=UPI0028D95A79|nr:TIGR01620 family protein [Vibrio cholerae]ELJ8694201.1 TIGR01620 family protein [Vibrio cholerae]